MTPPLNRSIADSPAQTLADVREAMSQRDDFAPAPEQYASKPDFFEVLAVLEALTIEGEVLA